MSEEINLNEQDIDENIIHELNTLVTELMNEENRIKLDEFVKSFIYLDRKMLLTKISVIGRTINNMFGEGTSRPVFFIISKESNRIHNLMNQIENIEIRNWLYDLNRKYIAYYEGVIPNFEHDWYRIYWATRIDATHDNIPFLSSKIVKRNGEIVYFDMPFDAALNLFIHQLRQMRNFQTGLPNRGALSPLRNNLVIIRELIDSIIEDFDEDNSPARP